MPTRQQFLSALNAWCGYMSAENRLEVETRLLRCHLEAAKYRHNNSVLYRGVKGSFSGNNLLESYSTHIGTARDFGPIVKVGNYSVFCCIASVWRSMNKLERLEYSAIEVGFWENEVICFV